MREFCDKSIGDGWARKTMKKAADTKQSKQTISTILTLLFTSMLLTACGSDKQSEKPMVETKATDEIILSPDGVGPINSTTSFNMHQMTLAFSNYSVVEELNFDQGEPLPAIRVSEGVKTIMTIIPDASKQNIYSVIVEDNAVSNSLGHHLGMAYNTIYTYGQKEDCAPGTADMSGKVLCYAPKNPNILYVFNGQANGNQVDTIPPADVLQDWGLESIIWRPK